MAKVNRVLWNLREDLEFNSRQMGELLGVNPTAWYKWELLGIIPLEETRKRVAAHFGMEVDDIWPGKGHIKVLHCRDITHALRSTDELWCRHTVVAYSIQKGQWDDVSCPACRSEKFNKYRKSVELKTIRERG